MAPNSSHESIRSSHAAALRHACPHPAPRTLGFAAALLTVVLALTAYLPERDSPLHFTPSFGTGLSAGDFTGLILAAGCLMGAWGARLSHRCPDAIVRRRLVGIAVLLAFWLFITVARWPMKHGMLRSLLWYLAYVPMAAIPLELLLCTARGAGLDKHPWARPVRVALRGSGLALISLALTNDLHGLFFFFDAGGEYTYGPAYGAFVLWAAVVLLGYLGVIGFAARRSLRQAAGFMALLALAIVPYTTLYLLDVRGVRALTPALVFSLLTVMAVEGSLALGLLPSFLATDEIFRSLPFPSAW